MKIIDISIPIKTGMTVYPNNPEVTIEATSRMPEGSSDVSKITMGTHTGTHLDAPRHAILNAGDIEALPFENYFGPAKVFDLSYLQPGEAVKISDLDGKEISAGDRLLFKTSNSARGYDSFYNDFVYLDGDCADFLVEKKVALVGIDYLSIKQKGSKDNRPHTSLLANGISILEGINLRDVAEGEYTISCFPLKIAEADGSPTRAVLIQNN